MPVRPSACSRRYMYITTSSSSACTARTPPAAVTRSITAATWPMSIIWRGRLVVAFVVHTFTLVNPPWISSGTWSITSRGSGTARSGV